jgi:OOP family OmpA-OmpF porin
MAFAILCATPLNALDLHPLNAQQTKSQSEAAGSVRIPKTPWTGTPTPLTEGRIDRQAFRIAQANLTTLQIIQPLRETLENSGYSEVFTCADASCGGFDFRFQLDLLPAPDMYVDLGNYRYTVMENAAAEPHTVSIMASRSQTNGFVHITQVSKAAFPDPVEPAETPTVNNTLDPTGIVGTLVNTGHAVLPDLEFDTGSAELGSGTYGSLQALSLWLETKPDAKIVLVGHTDSVGSLEANTNLSKRRALSVAARLTDEYGANAAQIEAAGAGYLSPIASNLTEEGRAENRRVEVVLLSLN